MLATFLESGTVLTADLVASESVSLTALASSYRMVLASGTWSGTDTANITGNGTATLTVTPAGQAALNTIRVTDSGPNASVTFADSGANVYTDDVSVALDDPGAGTIAFDGATVFTETSVLSAETSRNIRVSSGARVTTVNGALTLSANQQLTPTAGNFIGVDVTAGLIQATGAGTVTVQGKGGAGTGFQNRGVQVVGTGATITSGGGAVSVTGTGGGSGTGGFNWGVFVAVDGRITAGGGGTVTVVGQGGSGTGGGNYGVFFLGGVGTISSSGGAVSVTGIGGAGSDSFDVEMVSGAITSGANAPISLNADTLFISTVNLPPRIDSGSGPTTIKPRTAGRHINLGTDDTAPGAFLGLTDAELNRVFAGTINIGDTSSGTITVSAPISRAAPTNLNLTSAATTGLRPSANGTDLDLAGGALTIAAGSDLIINIAGATVDFGYDQLKVAGAVNLNGVDLSLTGGFVPFPGSVFTILSATSVTGAFSGLPENATGLFNGHNLRVNYTPTAVTLTDATVAATVASSAVSWGTSGNSGTLVTQGDGLRLLPSGRTTDMPWLGIDKITITLSEAASLSSGDVTVTGISVANYGPVAITGGGMSYTITLARPINAADRVTLTIANATISTYVRRLDVPSWPNSIAHSRSVGVSQGIS